MVLYRTMSDREGLRRSLELCLRAAGSDFEPDVDPDFLACVERLFSLRQQIEAGVLSAASLNSDEAAGLVLLGRVVKELETVEPCRCGYLPSNVLTCEACHKKRGSK